MLRSILVLMLSVIGAPAMAQTPNPGKAATKPARLEDAEGLLKGAWILDAEETIKQPQFKAIPTKHQALAEQMATNLAKTFKITFEAGHFKLTLSGDVQSEGNYTLSPTGELRMENAAGQTETLRLEKTPTGIALVGEGTKGLRLKRAP